MPRWFPFNPRKLWAAIRLADPPFESSPRDPGFEAVTVLNSIVFFLGLMGRDTPAGSVLLSDSIPVDDGQLHHTTRLPKKRVRLALRALELRHFVALRGESIIVLQPTCDILAPDPEDVAQAEKMRRYRERKQNGSGNEPHNETGNVTVTVVEPEKSRGEESREQPPSPAETPVAAPGGREPKQTQLVDPAKIRAAEILGLLWPRVSVAVTSAMTKTEWGKRNKRAALDMARVGLDDGAILAAHERLCERRGEVVYTLAWVQDELARGVVKDSTDDLPLVFAGGVVPRG